MSERSSGCPRVEALSAFVDGELPEPERDATAAHAAACPVCRPLLRQFQALSSAFDRLPEPSAGVDIAALVESRLPQRPRAKPPFGDRWRWRFAPVGLAAASALATGAYLGVLLTGGTAAMATRPAMAVFDAIPPGGFCAGLQPCGARGR